LDAKVKDYVTLAMLMKEQFDRDKPDLIIIDPIAAAHKRRTILWSILNELSEEGS
jgi:hypothetical protein